MLFLLKHFFRIDFFNNVRAIITDVLLFICRFLTTTCRFSITSYTIISYKLIGHATQNNHFLTKPSPGGTITSMKIAYFDCFSGISGDMCLGALVDAGVPLKHIEKELKKIPVKGYRLESRNVKRGHLSACKVDVVLNSQGKSPKSHHQNLQGCQGNHRQIIFA